MAKENEKIIDDGQNRCRRCDRPLIDPNDIYGWRCAKIVGQGGHGELPTLDETATNAYNAYVESYLSEGIEGLDGGPIASIDSYNVESKTDPSEILNTGCDSAGVWHDWDAEKYGVDSPVYKMLSGLNTAYEKANTYGHWSGDKERIADLAATLRVTDTNITDVIVMNNRQGAFNNGHNAVLLMNPSGQGFYFSYSSANGYIDDIGEMRFSILNEDEVNEIKDRSGEVYESVTIYGDRRWEKGKDAYDRFIWYDVPDSSAGERMFQYAADIFSNPGHYNALLKARGKQCDYVVSLILSAGGIEYEQKLKPNDSYELFKNNKTYWGNQSWSD
ncbi:MAG: hypothetical protein IJB80_05680 [Clostridia bacterium]|nr:hypothetical protein [Clostridia bacterium]